MLRKQAWAALAAVAALAACKSNAPAPPAAVPNTCSSDAECSTHFRCDNQLRRCVCVSDGACSGGTPYCNAFTGQCVAQIAGCTSNAACGSGQYCDTALRTCKPITGFCKACVSDAECGTGSSCLAHPNFPDAGKFCVSACGANSACASPLSCLGGSCFPATACGNSNACAPDSLKPCNADADCGDPAQLCDQTLKACVQRDHTCGAGFSCDPQSKVCRSACSQDSDCVAIEGTNGYQCRANACFRLNVCTQDSDCNNGQACLSNPDGSKSCAVACVPGATPSSCPLGQGCDATTAPNHPRCATGCTANSDCPLNTICAGGTCASSGGSCTQYCQATQVCRIAATCNSTTNCCFDPNLAQLCPPGGSCGTCPTSGSGCTLAQCANNCFPVNVVASKTGQAGCPGGTYYNSSAGACQAEVLLTSCSQDSDCPYKGFKCISKATFPGCGSGSVCFPEEPAAQTACGLGHP